MALVIDIDQIRRPVAYEQRRPITVNQPPNFRAPP